MTEPPIPPPCACIACDAPSTGEDRRCDACRDGHHGESRTDNPDVAATDYVLIDRRTHEGFLIPWVESKEAVS